MLTLRLPSAQKNPCLAEGAAEQRFGVHELAELHRLRQDRNARTRQVLVCLAGGHALAQHLVEGGGELLAGLVVGGGLLEERERAQLPARSIQSLCVEQMATGTMRLWRAASMWRC